MMTQPSEANSPARPRGWRGAFWAMARQRCPRCREGRIFRGAFTMNDPCPVCGLIFQREEGYFLGSMYVSYILSSAIMVPAYLVLAAWLPDRNGMMLALAVSLVYLPFVPMVWRYSRVLWIHFERAIAPGDVSATVYEKYRQRQLADQSRASEQDRESSPTDATTL